MFSARIPAQLGANRLATAVAARRAAGERGDRPHRVEPDQRAGFVYPTGAARAAGRSARAAVRAGAVRDDRGARGGRARLRAARHRRRRRSRRAHREHERRVSAGCSSCSRTRATRCWCRGRAIRCSSTSRGSKARRRAVRSRVPRRVVDRFRQRRGGADRRARARCCIVSPNNPTGSFVKRGELDRLVAIVRAARHRDHRRRGVRRLRARRHGARRRGPRARAARVLSFSLGGLSKSVGLPQVKLGWIAVGGAGCGRRRRARAARARVRHVSCRSRRRCRPRRPSCSRGGAPIRAADRRAGARQLSDAWRTPCRDTVLPRAPDRRRLVRRAAGAVAATGGRRSCCRCSSVTAC